MTGKDETDAFLGNCKRAVSELAAFANMNFRMSDVKIAELYRKANPELPLIYADAIRKLKSTT